MNIFSFFKFGEPERPYNHGEIFWNSDEQSDTKIPNGFLKLAGRLNCSTGDQDTRKIALKLLTSLKKDVDKEIKRIEKRMKEEE